MAKRVFTAPKGLGFYQKDTMKLQEPLLINGVELTEIPYDFSALTVDDMLKVDEARLSAGGGVGLNQMYDPITQFEAFCAAVTRADPTISRSDLRRMKYNDGMMAKARAILFFGGTLETALPPVSGDESPNSVTTREETHPDTMQ